VNLQLQMDPDQARYIPANVGAQIKATTAFGAKFVDLAYPSGNGLCSDILRAG
jgi:phospholipid/cholesterol/gamma-HCH transport system substrate-binding protein